MELFNIIKPIFVLYLSGVCIITYILLAFYEDFFRFPEILYCVATHIREYLLSLSIGMAQMAHWNSI